MKKPYNPYQIHEAPEAKAGTAVPGFRKTTSHREAERRERRLSARIGTDRKFPKAKVARESDENALAEFENLIEYTLRPEADDPDVAEFLLHGVEFVKKGREADELRSRYNGRPLLGGQSGRKTIGWTIEIGETLFVLSLFSAAKTNEKETNDFTDHLCSLIERHSIDHLTTGPFTRMVRSKKHGATLGDACERAKTTVHAYGRIPAEVWTERGRELFDRMIEEAVYDYKLTVDRLTRGAHAKLMNGEWAKSEDALPSLGCYKFIETPAGSRKTIATVVPNHDEVIPGTTLTRADLVRDFWTWASEDHTEFRIAELLSEKYGWGSEVLRQRLRNPKATVLDARNPDLVVRHLFRHLDLFETGTYYYEQRIPVADENVRTDVKETWREIGGVKFLSKKLDFHHELLPGGLWVDPAILRKARLRRLCVCDSCWTHWVETREARKEDCSSCRKLREKHGRKETGRAASRTVDRKPLNSLDTWSEDGFQYQLGSLHHEPYTLIRRTLDRAFDAHGRRLGWKREECELVATLNPAELHRVLSTAIVEALGTSGIQWHRELSPRKETVRPDEKALEAELAGARREAKKASTAYALAAENFEEDPSDAFRLAWKEASKAKAKADQRVRDIEDKITEAKAPVAATDLTDAAMIQINDLTAALALLHKTESKAPPALNLALRNYLTEFRAKTTEDKAHVEISTYVTVQSDEGPAILGPITCRVLNIRKEDKTNARREGVLARRFRDGETIQQIREALGFSNDYKVTKAIHSEFSKLGIVPSQGLRVALIDCPIPEVRMVVWAMIEEARSGEPFRVPQGVDPAFASHIRSTYSKPSGWVFSWALDNHETARAAIASAKAAGDDGLLWDLFYRDTLPKITDLAPRTVGEDLVRGKRRRGSNPVHLAPLFERSETWHGKNLDRRVWVRHCPFCGTRTLDHPIRVPEVPGGLICSTCRRTPELPTVVFPEGYGRKWAGTRDPNREKGELYGMKGTVEV